MSARGFGSVLWAGAVAGAALGFYLVSLNVASERAELEGRDVEPVVAAARVRVREALCDPIGHGQCISAASHDR